MILQIAKLNATFIPLTVQEIDGSPSVSKVKNITFNGATLTDLLNGRVLVTVSSAATAAGSTGAIQFNNSNALGADSSNLFWNDGLNILNVQGNINGQNITASGAITTQSLNTVASGGNNSWINYVDSNNYLGGTTNFRSAAGGSSTVSINGLTGEIVLSAAGSNTVGLGRVVVRGQNLGPFVVDQFNQAILSYSVGGGTFADPYTDDAVLVSPQSMLIQKTLNIGPEPPNSTNPGDLMVKRDASTGAIYLGNSTIYNNGSKISVNKNLDITGAGTFTGTNYSNNTLVVKNASGGLDVGTATISMSSLDDQGRARISVGSTDGFNLEWFGNSAGSLGSKIEFRDNLIAFKKGSADAPLTAGAITSSGTISTTSVVQGSQGGLFGTPNYLGRVTVKSLFAGDRGLVVQGFPSQTANLQEWQNNAGTVLSLVDASGNFGIGTTSPLANLHIERDSVAEDNSDMLILKNNSQSTYPYSGIVFDTNKNSGGNYINFKTNGTLRGQISYAGSGNALQLINSDNGPLTLQTNNTERMRIDSAGNVGIGTSSPARKLHISQAMRLEPLGGSQPANPSRGDLYSDNDTGTLCYYDGSAWVPVAGGSMTCN